MTTDVLARPRWPMAARAVLRALEQLAEGRLRLTLPDGAQLDFGARGAQAELTVRDWRTFGRTLRTGDIGFAEGWIDGDWTTGDLPALLGVLAANRDALEAPLHGSVLGRIAHRLLHLARANTRSGSRRNIAAHYDLGNAFYALWLDQTMTYSSALFPEGNAGGSTPDRSALAAGQHAKYARALDALGLAQPSHILEIGCGWGGFTEHAVLRGHTVSGVTLSREQLDFARARLERLGAGTRADLQLRDYRDLEGRYDAVVSLEMLEAVGQRWWPAYFARLAASLDTGGRALVQSIVIDDRLFERYRRGTDFIQRYVFPGGMLPSPARLREEARRAGLALRDAIRFGAHYADTLAAWRRNFAGATEEVRALGFDERFIRMWNFYLAYCEAGFRSGSTDVVQYTLERT